MSVPQKHLKILSLLLCLDPLHSSPLSSPPLLFLPSSPLTPPSLLLPLWLPYPFSLFSSSSFLLFFSLCFGQLIFLILLHISRVYHS